jgi:hypothetical protein
LLSTTVLLPVAVLDNEREDVAICSLVVSRLSGLSKQLCLRDEPVGSLTSVAY